jgi:hypothetical protein
VPCILMAQEPTQEDIMTGDARAAAVDWHVLLVIGMQQCSSRGVCLQETCKAAVLTVPAWLNGSAGSIRCLVVCVLLHSACCPFYPWSFSVNATGCLDV